MTATGVPWARWNTRIVKIVETALTYVWTLASRLLNYYNANRTDNVPIGVHCICMVQCHNTTSVR